MRFRKYFLRTFAALFVFSVLAFYLSQSWEWSTMDDSGYALTFLKGIGFAEHVAHMYREDVSFGLFRPSYWVYASTVYQWSPDRVFLTRAFMFLCAVLLPLSAIPLSSIPFALTAWALLVSNTAFYFGLSFPSMQELSGCFFVSLAFLAIQRFQAIGLGLLFFLMAAWFKAPFIWLTGSFGIFWYFNGKRRWGLTSILVCIGSVILFSQWAKGGSYTGRFDVFAFNRYFITIRESLVPTAALIVPMVLLALVSGIKGRAWKGWPWLAAGVLYFLNLLPWGASHYYFMGSFYLIALGAIVSFKDHRIGTSAIPFAACLVAVAWGTLNFTRGFYKVYSRNAMVQGVRDWASTLPAGSIISVNADEPVVRFNQLMEIRKPQWSGRFIPWRQEKSHYLIVLKEGAPVDLTGLKLIHDVPWALIFQPD